MASSGLITLPATDQRHSGHPDADNGHSRSGFQKRIDKLTREKYELLAKNQDLRQANQELTVALATAERLIGKYKAAFMRKRT